MVAFQRAMEIGVDSLELDVHLTRDKVLIVSHDDTAQRMLSLAAEQPGYLGVESARDGVGITVSYWRSLEDIANWKRVTDHLEAQRTGRAKWYASFKTRIAKVERDYGFER